MKQIVDDSFPEEVVHLLLAKNTPEQMFALFDSNPKIKRAFEQCLANSVPQTESNFSDLVKGSSRVNGPAQDSEGSADESGGYDDELGGSDPSEMDDAHDWHAGLLGHLRRALQQCQAKLQACLLDAGVIHRDDIDLHLVHKSCAEDDGRSDSRDDHHIFLALRSRTQALDCDVHDIDARPIAPHARWAFARVLAALCGRRWDPHALEGRRPAPWERRGRSLAVRACDPPAAGPRWKVVVTEDD
jgi:hypothetical protein